VPIADIFIERQVNDSNTNSAITHEPVTPSQLVRSASITEERPPLPAVAAEEAKDE